MSSKLYIGNGQATPSIVVEKPVPMPLTIQKSIDADGYVINGSTIIDLNGATKIGEYALACAYYNNLNLNGEIILDNLTDVKTYGLYNTFYNCTGITSVKIFGNIEIYYPKNYACSGMFQNCTNISSADLSGLKIISSNYCCSNMFSGCTSLQTVDLSNLEYIGSSSCASSMFSNCTNLTDVDVSSIATAGYSSCRSMFSNCKKLENISFTSFSILDHFQCFQNMFQNCTSLKNVYFPMFNYDFSYYKDDFYNMLSGCTGVTLHFPVNMETYMPLTSGYPNYGGTDTVILYDQIASNNIIGTNGTTYYRNAKYDGTNYLSWRLSQRYLNGDFSYTQGSTYPQVGDTIYSDPECTIALTTIDSIV